MYIADNALAKSLSKWCLSLGQLQSRRRTLGSSGRPGWAAPPTGFQEGTAEQQGGITFACFFCMRFYVRLPLVGGLDWWLGQCSQFHHLYHKLDCHEPGGGSQYAGALVVGA